MGLATSPRLHHLIHMEDSNMPKPKPFTPVQTTKRPRGEHGKTQTRDALGHFATVPTPQAETEKQPAPDIR